MTATLEWWDGACDQESISNGLMELYNKHIGPGQVCVEFTKELLIVYAPDGRLCLSYSPEASREIYGRLSHFGLSVRDIEVIRSIQ